MKIGLFADPHYCTRETAGGRYYKKSLDKIRQVLELFEKEGCELVICLGDVIDVDKTRELERDNLVAVSRVLDEARSDLIVVMGNHDGFCFTPEDFYSTIGKKYMPRTIKAGDKSLIFLDANYFKSGIQYSPGDSDWTDCYVPCLDELKKELDSAQGDCYLFMHQNADPDICESHLIYNHRELRELVRDSGKVRAVIQGHFHAGNRSVHDGADYITIPAMGGNEASHLIIEI